MSTLSEKFSASGHRNITARHKSTLEFTKDRHLSLQGDCIIAVSSDKCFSDFHEEFLDKLRDSNSVVEVLIECNGVRDKVVARGDEALTLSHPSDMVVRKSNYICDRTLAVEADKAAVDLDRRLLEELRKGGLVEIIVRLH